MGFGWR
ncbi:hypothetical protein LINPERPRIM_LOCUS38833 [Linum perenne]